jgi:hypothetical protein
MRNPTNQQESNDSRYNASETRVITIKPSKSERNARNNGESELESGGARRHARACPVARAGGAQHATEPHRTPNERYATHTIHEPYTPSNSIHMYTYIQDK